jgi:hypothetical protein
MALPEPKPGLVIRYSYLWNDEAERGRDEGRKDRPCVVILAVQTVNGQTVVTVAPTTHTPPSAPGEAVEIPPAVKQRLGLDDQRSWVVTTEVNRFAWPGTDLRPVSREKRNVFAFGYAPGALVEAIRRQIAVRRGVRIVSRAE